MAPVTDTSFAPSTLELDAAARMHCQVAPPAVRALLFPEVGVAGETRELIGEGALAAAAAAVRTQQGWIWVDITRPDADTLDTLASAFNLNRAALAECLQSDQRPLFREQPGHLYLVLPEVAGPPLGSASGQPPGHRRRLPTFPLFLFLLERAMLALHAEPSPLLDLAWQEFQGVTGAYDTLRPDRLLHALAEDALALFPALTDRLEERIDGLERQIFRGRRPHALDRIFSLKRDLLAMRRVLAQVRDAYGAVARRDTGLLPTGTRALFGDLHDRALRLMDLLESLRDLLASLVDAHLTVQGYRLSEIMKTLTIIATTLMPLSVVTGFFGMNFVHLPGLNSPTAMWATTATLVSMAASMVLYFRTRGWW